MSFGTLVIHIIVNTWFCQTLLCQTLGMALICLFVADNENGHHFTHFLFYKVLLAWVVIFFLTCSFKKCIFWMLILCQLYVLQLSLQSLWLTIYTFIYGVFWWIETLNLMFVEFIIFSLMFFFGSVIYIKKNPPLVLVINIIFAKS